MARADHDAEKHFLGSRRASGFHAAGRKALRSGRGKNHPEYPSAWWTRRGTAACFLFPAATLTHRTILNFKLFPPHCVKGTPGARIIPEGLTAKRLTFPNDAFSALPEDFLLNYEQIVLEKQTLDVFTNPKADEIVNSVGPDVDHVVFGVVTEYCVRCAARGLLERGCKVAVVEDAIETLNPEVGSHTLNELKALGARLITTKQAVARVAAPFSHEAV